MCGRGAVVGRPYDCQVDQGLSDSDLSRIQERVDRALEISPLPWSPWRETREGTGGCSFIQFGGHPDEDNEMYLYVRLGRHRLVSPDTRLDAIVDLIGNAPEDILRLIGEVKRLRD